MKMKLIKFIKNKNNDIYARIFGINLYYEAFEAAGTLFLIVFEFLVMSLEYIFLNDPLNVVAIFVCFISLAIISSIYIKGHLRFGLSTYIIYNICQILFSIIFTYYYIIKQIEGDRIVQKHDKDINSLYNYLVIILGSKIHLLFIYIVCRLLIIVCFIEFTIFKLTTTWILPKSDLEGIDIRYTY
uniref:Uncharacterized protein n=2 Tax=Strongyloides stercoralis TaxID=6248 RepID=A0AAF5D2Y5_STRER